MSSHVILMAEEVINMHLEREGSPSSALELQGATPIEVHSLPAVLQNPEVSDVDEDPARMKLGASNHAQEVERHNLPLVDNKQKLRKLADTQDEEDHTKNPNVSPVDKLAMKSDPVSRTTCKPHWNPNDPSKFPLPQKARDGTPLLKIKRPDDNTTSDQQSKEAITYITPRISSSLQSYGHTWQKLKSNSSRDVQDDFKKAVFTNNIEMKLDTSITGSYAKKNYVPFGFEPSTEEACKKEQYTIINLSNQERKEEDTFPPKISPLSYYQSWDPFTMRYEPKLKRPEDGAAITKAFPLGAAAAGTRAALLSFMGTRGEMLATSSATNFPNESNNLFDASYAGDIIGIDTALAEKGSMLQSPTSPMCSVPEKIIIQPQNVSPEENIKVANDGGGKKIDEVAEKLEKVVPDEIKRKRGSEDDSSSKQTRISVDTDDAVCDGSSVRRGKRQRISRQNFDS